MKSTDPSNGRERRSTSDKGVSKTHGDAVLYPYELEDLYEPIKRGLKSRHAQMIALGGTGLVVGSEATLAREDPAFILVCYILLAILMLFVVTVITEAAAPSSARQWDLVVFWVPLRHTCQTAQGMQWVSCIGTLWGYLFHIN